MIPIRDLLPVRAVRRRAELPAPPQPPAVVLRAGALGFAGARDEDRDRWLASFRLFLDALGAPLQAVVSLRTLPIAPAGGGAPAPAGRVSEVRLVVRPPDAERARDLLSDLGVACSAGPAQGAELSGEEFKDAVRDGPAWHRTLWLARYPGIDLQPGWWLELVPQGVTADLSWHAVPLPTAWMIGHLQRRLAGLRATQLAVGAPDVHVEAAVPAAESLQRRLAASEERAFQVSLYLTIHAGSRRDLDTATERVRHSARGLLATIEPATFEMLTARISTLAVGADPLARHHVLDTSSAATLFPWRDAELRHPDGLAVGFSRSTGLPVAVDPFDQRLFANANIGVFGHSGAGKTYLMSCLALGAHAAGAQVFVLDPENEYGALAREVGGTAVQLALGSGQALNVMPPVWRVPGSDLEASIGPAAADVVDLVAIVSGGLDEAGRAQVERAAREAYRERPEPVLRDVAARLAPGRTKDVLERWVNGSLGAIFSAPTNVDLDGSLVVFGMRELRDEMIAPVHFLLAEALWSRIKRRDRRRLLVIDELGLLFEDPTLRRLVVSLARRIRKYDGSLVFATQNPGDLLATEAGSVVATNPAIHFFGATRPGEAARLQRAFELSATQRTLVESARRGEFLLAAGAERLPIRVQAAPEHAALIERARTATHPARPPPARS